VKKSLSEPTRVAEIVDRCDAVGFDLQPAWGIMTAHQMVQHLVRAMSGPMSGQVMSPRTWSPLGNRVGRFSALRSGIRWPRNVPTVPPLDQRGKPLPDPATFAADLAQLRADLPRFAAFDPDALSREHPIFGRFTREDWMAWGYLHADHHLRQFGC
jgi:hypothetical protein